MTRLCFRLPPRRLPGRFTALGLAGVLAVWAGAGCRTEHVMSVKPARNIVWTVSSQGLDSGLLAALERVARRYRHATGHPITITSGRRTLRHQARLMAAMTPAQLEGMYCRHGYPGYIRDLIAARQRFGALSPEQAYDILRNRHEGYISSHLYGAAVDISPRGMAVALLKHLLAEEGFRALDERNLGIACIHATFKAAPVRIIRK